MVFNGGMLVSAAKTSSEVWQYMACLGEEQRIDGQQMVDLVICFPLQQLGRLLFYLWTFLCVPPQLYYPNNNATISYYDDTDTSDDDDDDDDGSSTPTTFRYFYYQRGPDAAADDSSHTD